jgi:hypothetical protein
MGRNLNSHSQSNTAQLVFGRNSVLNIKSRANWAFIKERKQKLINKNNEEENSSQLAHEYKVNYKVWMKNLMKSKCSEEPWKGPFSIVGVNDN